MEDYLSETGHSLTENQIDAVIQDIQENFEENSEENFETCTKEIVKRAQDFKKKPRNHYQNPPPNHHYLCEICHDSLPEGNLLRGIVNWFVASV